MGLINFSIEMSSKEWESYRVQERLSTKSRSCMGLQRKKVPTVTSLAIIPLEGHIHPSARLP